MQTSFQGVYAGRPVLVTGHTGFKGSWLTVWLRELGAQVVGYSLGCPTEPGNFQLCKLGDKMVDVRGDIRTFEPLRETIRAHRPEIVFHLAAQPIVITGYEEPKTTFDTNVGGVVNLLEAVRDSPSVKAVVVVTSDKVYEDQHWMWGYRESDRLGGFDPYAASKAMAELAVQSYRRSWDQEWTAAGGRQRFGDHPVSLASGRAGNVIGGGDFSNYRLVPDCMRALTSGTPIVLRNPSSVRHWQFMLEPLGGYLWLGAHLLRGEARFADAWNFGPPAEEAITCALVAERCRALWGTTVPIVVPNQQGVHETSVLKVNWEKAGAEGWRPTYTWQEALEETVTWWKQYDAGRASVRELDLYDVCAQQIARYTERSRVLGIGWAETAVGGAHTEQRAVT